MATLISLAVHDTDENGRSTYTRKTIDSLLKTVDFKIHYLGISDNDSCRKTQGIYDYLFAMWPNMGFGAGHLHFCKNKTNIGTAEAVNMIWKHRIPGQPCIKMDNDVVIHKADWVDEMEEAITRWPEIGILGLKRKDLWETPTNQNFDFRSKLIMLPHETGQRWIIVEQAPHIMGTCQMYNPLLLDKIGYLRQPGLYGFDDSLASLRSSIAGFRNCFLPHIEIEHIDTGGDAYFDWKQKEAGRGGKEFANMRAQYQSGELPIYYNPFE